MTQTPTRTPKPRKGQSVLISVVIDPDLWSVPVLARKDFGDTYTIRSGKVWRGAVVKENTVKVIEGVRCV